MEVDLGARRTNLLASTAKVEVALPILRICRYRWEEIGPGYRESNEATTARSHG
jgi:hypothetical protein